MMKVPVKFRRMAAAFDEGSRVRSCRSSGSEHSAADLSDLVNSFLEREITEGRETDHEVVDQDKDVNDQTNDEAEGCNSADAEFGDKLKSSFDFESDGVRRSVHAAVEKALREVGGVKNSSPDFKRRLMALLRSRGFDAGLCKSKWEKNGRIPSGEYEYIDVNAGGTRYIVEVSLAGVFTIARPTSRYASLLDVFPAIFIGRPDELKPVLRLMSTAIRKSMKCSDLNVPPWRRLAYMEAKWFGSYRRTTNEIPSRPQAGDIESDLAGKRRLGFAPLLLPGFSLYCREDFAAKAGVRIGNLAAALNQN